MKILGKVQHFDITFYKSFFLFSYQIRTVNGYVILEQLFSNGSQYMDIDDYEYYD